VLLLVPLANCDAPPSPFRVAVTEELACLSTDDARFVYEAIRVANPGGLGEAPEQDVRDEPTVTLLGAMQLAADRDMVARQYANGFADVFDFGVPAFTDAFAKFGCVEAAIIDSQLRWLAAYPDSLIARKNGPAVAEDVQKRAAEVLSRGGIATPEGRAAGVALDKHLRSDGNRLNPGTTADLITACLFVALRENKVAPSSPFRWQVSDWL
jgi:triphosphoribosyl-dephospho-CoA synthase